jgi:hypothetical protein
MGTSQQTSLLSGAHQTLTTIPPEPSGDVEHVDAEIVGDVDFELTLLAT